MNERDTIPPAEKLAQFEGAFTPVEMLARVAKLLGIGLNPESGTPRIAQDASEAGARYHDTPETPDAPLRAPCDDYKPIGTGECWTCGQPFYKHGDWQERREAFCNECDALDDMLDNWEVEP